MARDASAYIDFLDAQPFVSSGPMGVIGFCFVGKFALRVAAARPDRIAAAASFHGGGLFTDTDETRGSWRTTFVPVDRREKPRKRLNAYGQLSEVHGPG
jgi:dienelactone hydrolase